MPISRSSKNRVIVTMGDPSGIGPEVVLKALASPKVKGLADFLLIGDGFVIDRLEKRLGLKLTAPILDLSNVPRKNFSYGKKDAAFGKASIEYIDRAVALLNEGSADCLATAPINKASIRICAVPGFEGHTEYLARKTRAKNFAMMFVGGSLKVTLVTRHIALGAVAKNISIEAVHRTIALTHAALKELFRIKSPRIGVAGLNPHAGEDGAFGSEEARLIRPAIEKASVYMGGISGPLAPDVVFFKALNNEFDAVVSMYHDQGLIPFKMLYFKNGVNMTLGLPFIRTSPDHGTAFDIAGQGIADPASMIEALTLACRLAHRPQP